MSALRTSSRGVWDATMPQPQRRGLRRLDVRIASPRIMAGCAAAAAAVMNLVAGCGSDASSSAPSGLREPVRVRATLGSGETVAAQFVYGSIPNENGGPAMLAIDNNQTLVFPGEYGKSFGGTVGNTATAAALKIDELGSGYWVAPVYLPSSEIAGGLTWKVKLDFARDVSPGLYHVRAVGVDEAGRVGSPMTAQLYLQPGLPTGDLVVSLTWDVNADLDLHVVGPDGLDVGPKLAGASPMATGLLDAGGTNAGVLDRDSNASCSIDSWRMENAAWAAAPPGLYRVYVDMFSACGQPSATFTVRVFRRELEYLTQSGRLLSIDADNGSGPYLQVSSFELAP